MDTDDHPEREARIGRRGTIAPGRRAHVARVVALGLAALAVSLAVGRVVPALIDESKGWFVALGVGFAVLAMAFTLYGTNRQRQLDRSIAGGDFRPLDGTVVFLLTGLMALLAVTTIVLVLAAL